VVFWGLFGGLSKKKATATEVSRVCEGGCVYGCVGGCCLVFWGLVGGVSQQKKQLQAVEADGGVGNFAKNTTTNVISGTWGKLSNVVGFTTEILTSKAKSLESDVKKAGGVCVCMCVCSTRERARERAREYVQGCVCVCERESVCVCV